MGLALTMPGTLAKQPQLSVIIPARNEEANLGTCLESLVSQTGVDFEIIVGTASAGVVGIGAAIGVLNVHSATEAYIGNGTVSAGGNVTVDASLTECQRQPSAGIDAILEENVHDWIVANHCWAGRCVGYGVRRQKCSSARWSWSRAWR